MNHTIHIKTSDPVINHFQKTFKRCIGTGRFDLGLREDYMNNLRIVQKEIGFEMIRGHGILDDHVGVYRKHIQVDASHTMELKEAVFNFSRVIKVMKNYQSVGIKPFIELGFMPNDLAEQPHHFFWWKGNASSPKEMKEWLRLIQQLLETLIEHFGIEEVKTWPIEVWNEPNADFWQPPEGKDKETTYYALYEQTARLIKTIHPELIVGGPATNGQGMDWLERFIQHCKANHIPLDFISQHVYASYDKTYSGEFIYMKLQKPEEVLAQFQAIQQFVLQSNQPDLPIHITEWNSSYSCIELVHDTALNAAFIAWVLTHADPYVDSLSYWVLSDVFEEADIPRALFHGGFGLLTENGIRKPTFHTFAFANRLHDQILHLDHYGIVTRNAQGHVAILLFNPCLEPTDTEIEVNLQIPIPFEDCTVQIEKVDEVNGNAYATWRTLGSPRIPLDHEMDAIKKAQYPAFEIHAMEPNEQGMIHFSTLLPANGIQFIEILPRKNQTDSYQGLQKKYFHG